MCFLISFVIITDIYIFIDHKFNKFADYKVFFIYIGIIIILTGLLYLLAYLSGITKEPFYATFKGPKFCRGGAYLYQGDSENAKYCRSLYENPEGQEEICKFSCGKDQHNGYPSFNFKYSPLSNSNWKNERSDTENITDENTLGFVSNPTFQANISPRFDNADYNSAIKYNMPDKKYLAV